MSQTAERTSSTDYEQQLRSEVSPPTIQEHLNHFSTLAGIMVARPLK